MARAGKTQPGVRPHVIRSLTLRNLSKNRMRSAVTVIGVALSCALLCAVLVSVNSFITLLRDLEVAGSGAWHASVETTDASAIASARENAQVADLTDLTYVGQLQSWAPQEDGDTEADDADEDDAEEPVAAQVTVQALDASFEDLCALHLSEGRLPKNSHEIVLSAAYEGTCELTDEPCELGSTVSGELMARVLKGGSADELTPATSIGAEGEETLEASGVQASYTVVGFYDPTVFYSDLLSHTGDVAVLDDGGSLTYRNVADQATVAAQGDGESGGASVSEESSATGGASAPADSEASASASDSAPADSSACSFTYVIADSRAFTFADADLVTARSHLGMADSHTVYLSTQGVSTEGDLTALVQGIFGTDVGVTLHSNLLRYSLITSDRAIWDTLFIIAGVICAVVVIASVSLIFNAFAISVAERTRQFGLLSSIGASRRQIRSMVFWEAGVIAAIGIPCGLVVGVVGSTLVLGALSGRVEGMLNYGLDVHFHACVDAFSLVAAAVLGLLVVVLSAWVPSRRAAAVSAVDALRNVSDQRLSARQRRLATRRALDPWRSKGIGGRILGLPAELAARTSSRGRAKARVATASLAVAVMLFVSAGALDQALMRIAGATGSDQANWDLSVTMYSGDEAPLEPDQAQELYAKMGALDGVTARGMLFETTFAAAMPTAMAGSDVYGYADSQGDYQFQASVTLLDDDTFNKVAVSQGLSPDQFYDSEHACAIAYNGSYLRTSGKYANVDYFAQSGTVTLLAYDSEARGEARYCYENVADDGTFALMPADGRDSSSVPQYSRAEHASAFNEVEVVSIMKSGEEPSDITMPTYACLIMPMSNVSALLAGNTFSEVENVTDGASMTCTFNAVKPDAAYDAAMELLHEYAPGLSFGIQNVAETRQSAINLVVVLNTFSYAFAAILALVAVANVFNTIVSSLMLRRREFAVLQSLGMTRKGISRMVAWECVRFGARGLIFGLVASVVVTQLIFYALTRSFDGLAFEMPWLSVGIAMAGACVVTALASAYGLKHAKADNVVEALRMQ